MCRAYFHGVVMMLGPLLIAVAAVCVDAWVFIDARRWLRAGTPVECRLGTLHIATPIGWALACVVLFVVFVPIYLVARRD